MKELLANSRVIAIVGRGKNVGKTTTLNHILKLYSDEEGISITSIGYDGEDIDNITETIKPRIYIYPNTYFATTTFGLKHSNFLYEIIEKTNIKTALGNVVIGVAKGYGNILLCGPSIKNDIQCVIDKFKNLSNNKIFIDGAFNKSMQAEPYLSDAMVLATGAAYSTNIEEIVLDTKYIISLYSREYLYQDKISDLYIYDALFGDIAEFYKKISSNNTIRLKGSLTDNFIKELLYTNKKVKDIVLVVDNPTICFLSRKIFEYAKVKNISIRFLHTTEIKLITINPVSINGIFLDSEKLINDLKEITDIAIYDVVKEAKGEN